MGCQPVSARRARSVDPDASRRLLREESSARVGVCLKEVDFPASLGWAPRSSLPNRFQARLDLSPVLQPFYASAVRERL